VGFASFTDGQVNRPEAQRLAGRVTVTPFAGGAGLLDGAFEAEVVSATGVQRVTLELPPGAPGRPPSDAELAAKVADCCGAYSEEVMALGWSEAGDFLRRTLA
jgi:hypothetical protein